MELLLWTAVFIPPGGDRSERYINVNDIMLLSGIHRICVNMFISFMKFAILCPVHQKETGKVVIFTI